MSLKEKPMFPAALLEGRKPVPNLIININSLRNYNSAFDPPALHAGDPDDLMSIDPRYFLPLTHKTAFFEIRNVILTGANPARYPELERALQCFSGRVERLRLVIRADRASMINPKTPSLLQEIIILIPPVSISDYPAHKRSLNILAPVIHNFRKANPKLLLQAILYLSAGNLSRLDEEIDMIEKAGFDRLNFFPANLYLTPDKGRSRKPLDPSLSPPRETVSTIEKNFWQILEERCFESRLFDLNICRRQLERTLEYFKAAHNAGTFSPPYCRAARIAFFIESTGVIRCCPYQKPFGDLTKNSLIEISQSEELHLFQADLNLARNPLCPACPGAFPYLLMKSR